MTVKVSPGFPDYLESWLPPRIGNRSLAAMSILVQGGPTRDDTERSLGIARRGRGRMSDSAAADGDEAASTALWLGLIVFVALSARVLVFVLGPGGDVQRAMDPAGEIQLRQSVNLVEHAVFSQQAADGLAGPRPEEGLPGYPAVLAAAAWLGVPLKAVLMLQIVMGAAGAALVFGIALALFEQRAVAVVAGAVAAVHPAGLVAANTFAADAIFTTLLLAGVWLAAARRRHDFAGSLMGGLALGAAVLLRPLSALAGAAVATWVMISDRRLAGLGAAAVLAIASLAPAGLWMLRNHQAELPLWPGGMVGGEGAWTQLLSDPATAVDVSGRLFTAHATQDLYARLGLGAPAEVDSAPLMNPAGAVALAKGGAASAWVALAWSGLNALLGVGSLAGLVLLVVRGRWSAALLLGGVMVYWLATWTGADAERWHAPVVGLQAVAAASVLMRVPRRESHIRRWLQRKPKVAEEDEAAQIIPILTGRPL